MGSPIAPHLSGAVAESGGALSFFSSSPATPGERGKCSLVEDGEQVGEGDAEPGQDGPAV
jgi:hypothetical protein